MTKKPWVFDLNKIKANEFEVMQEELGTGKLEANAKWYAKCLVSAPVDNFNDPQNLLSLGIKDFFEATAAFREAFRSVSTALEAS